MVIVVFLWLVVSFIRVCSLLSVWLMLGSVGKVMCVCVMIEMLLYRLGSVSKVVWVFF